MKIRGIFKNENGSATSETLLTIVLLLGATIFITNNLKKSYITYSKIKNVESMIEENNKYCRSYVCGKTDHDMPIYCDLWKTNYYSASGRPDSTEGNKYVDGFRPVCILKSEQVSAPGD